MPWVAALLSVAQSGASQSSQNANGGQNTTGGGLGTVASVAGAANKTPSPGASGSPASSGGFQTSLESSPSAPSQFGYHFYGGETVSQIKNSAANKVVLHGCTDGLKNNEEKGFYKNVHIPKKKV